MAITKIGAAFATANTANLPAFAAGDLAVVFAYRNNNATAPSLPAGWTNINSLGSNTNSQRTGYRVLVGTDTTTGVWTNATHIEVIVLRGQSTNSPVGGQLSRGDNTTTLATPAVSLAHGDSTSWVVAFAGSKATDANTKTLAGTTDEASTVTALNLATGRGVASWAQTNYSAAVNAAGNQLSAVEVLVAGSYVRATQAVVEGVYKPTTVSMRATQVVLEVVYKESPIQPFTTVVLID
jgi:hypothetical protein